MPTLKQVADRIVETDVLIIGGGAGGSAAAIRARQEGVDVLVVEKGGVAGGGSLAASPNTLHIAFPEKQSFADALESEKRTIYGLVHSAAFRMFYEDSLRRMQDLERWGCPMIRDDNDEIYVRTFLGFPHTYFADPIKQGPKAVMLKQARKQGVKFERWTMITNLLIQDGRVEGATGLDVRSGEFIVFKSGATILATGTGTRLYRPASGNSFVGWHPPYCTGDGHAMAYRAGAELSNMEIPCFTMAIQGLASYLALEILYMPYCEAPLLNRQGERFLTRYDPVLLEMTSRDVFCRAILDEYEAGRGPVFIDTSKMSPKSLDEWRRGAKRGSARMLIQYLEAQGIELGKDLLEVGLTEPILYSGGVSGCWIDDRARTNVPGLYAIGDVASGTGARGINGAICAGWRAGGHGAQVAGATGPADVDPETVARERARVLGPLGRKGGIRPKELEALLNGVMSDHVGYRRTAEGLEAAIAQIGSLRERGSELTADTPHELMRALEVQNLIDCGELIAQTALSRQESPAVPFHYQRNFPEKAERTLLDFVIARKEGERMGLIRRPA